MIAVGATNVGSIQIEFDEALKTNTKRKFECEELVFSKQIGLEKGQHFGLCNLGSTIVLVFEAPDSEIEATIKLVSKVMVEAPAPAVHLSAPLQVDARAAANWDEAH